MSLDLAFVAISVVFFSGESSRDIFGEEIHFVATSRIAEQAIRIRSRRAVITLVIAMRARADRASALASNISGSLFAEKYIPNSAVVSNQDKNSSGSYPKREKSK